MSPILLLSLLLSVKQIPNAPPLPLPDRAVTFFSCRRSIAVIAANVRVRVKNADIIAALLALGIIHPPVRVDAAAFVAMAVTDLTLALFLVIEFTVVEFVLQLDALENEQTQHRSDVLYFATAGVDGAVVIVGSTTLEVNSLGRSMALGRVGHGSRVADLAVVPGVVLDAPEALLVHLAGFIELVHVLALAFKDVGIIGVAPATVVEVQR